MGAGAIWNPQHLDAAALRHPINGASGSAIVIAQNESGVRALGQPVLNEVKSGSAELLCANISPYPSYS
jgi:hypothetical protein